MAAFFSKHAFNKSFHTALQNKVPPHPVNFDFKGPPSLLFFPLGAYNCGVVGRVGEGGVRAVVQEAVAPAAVADQEERG